MRLKFHTSRPESFVIYKRSSEGGPWVPYQYYSGSCQKTYQKLNRGFIRTGEDEQQALCTDDFSDISPLTGGNVAFSTLEGRPSAYNFDNSPVLQVSGGGGERRRGRGSMGGAKIGAAVLALLRGRARERVRGFSPSIPLSLLCYCQVLQLVARQRPRLSHCRELQLEAPPLSPSPLPRLLHNN